MSDSTLYYKQFKWFYRLRISFFSSDFSAFYFLISDQSSMMSPLPLTIPQSQPIGLNPNANMKIELENADLWQKFHQHTTEMIVNKTGR